MDPYIQFRSGNPNGIGELAPSQILNGNAVGIGQKKTRGPTQMREIWGIRDGERLQVALNNVGQPDDKMGHKLSLFIGTIVRDGKNAPLVYNNWHQVPEHYKDHIWALVQSKFEIPSLGRTWVMKCAGKKLKDWKADLKKNWYIPHLTFEQQRYYKDKRVYADQWEHLIQYWGTDKAKTRSDKNKSSRASKNYNHTTGSKSFPRIRKEQKEKLEHSPTRVDLFKVCYSKKDGTPNGDKTKKVMEEMDAMKALDSNLLHDNTTQNDVFAQVMGKEKPGRVRMYGLGVSPSDLWKDVPGCSAYKNTTLNAMQTENMELRLENDNLKSLLMHAQPNLASVVAHVFFI